MWPKLTSSSILVAGVTYIGVSTVSILPSSKYKITTDDANPDSFTCSATNRLINPKNHVAINDTHSVTLEVGDLSDEVILARFVKGFFGGWVLTPERIGLRVLGRTFTCIEATDHLPVHATTWTVTSLFTSHLPSVGTLLFGVFRVIDVHIDNSGLVKPDKAETTSAERGYTNQASYIDFAFGSDTGFLKGVHRFGVVRSATNANKSDASDVSDVTLRSSHTSIRPTVNKPLGPLILVMFHNLYAASLFREGLSAVLRD